MILACLVRAFPRLSQTFILDELLRLEGLGVDLRLFTLAAGDEDIVHADVGRLRARPVCLDPAPPSAHAALAARHGRRYLDALAAAAREADHGAGYHVAGRWRCFGQAVALAGHLRPLGPVHLHAHFAHDPALVAWLAHRLAGVPFTFTAHARDVHQVRPEALARRARDARAVVACCAANAAVLERLAPGKVRLVHHGVDLERFRPEDSRARGRGVPVVLTVGRLVEKKGISDLLAALAAVPFVFEARIAGDGPQRGDLEQAARRLGIADRVRFLGPRTRDEVAEACREAAVFALTPVPTAGGDVDGLPNAILEAMASGLPVVATRAGGVAEAVSDGVDGLLAAPGDLAAITRNLTRLLGDPVLRRRMGQAARRSAEARFDARAAAVPLYDLFATTTAM